MKLRLAANPQPDSIVDGSGIRTVIWFQGCLHNCPYCHNPETHDLNGGFETTTEEVCEFLDNVKYQTGITLSGGDPFFQPNEAKIIADHAHSIGLNVWAYTGFTYEQILKDELKLNLLKSVDILVDGRFEIDKKSLNCKFRGSTNQRLIDVNESLKEGSVILYDI